MRSIARDFGWAFLAAITIGGILKMLSIEAIPWWVFPAMLPIAIALLVYGYWPKKDLSKERIQLILPDKVIDLEPSIWRKIKNWLKTH